jgi:hypothetical protein
VVGELVHARGREIWALQEPLDFPRAAYGLAREEADMRAITLALSERLGAHRDDEPID